MADLIRHLDVCAGIGGFSLGLKLALGPAVRTVGYVERDSFCAAVLLARMEDETLDCAPMWCGSLEDLDGCELRGEVDVFTAGYPCQPFSAAGKLRGHADLRAIWPAIADLIAEVEPAIVLLENVRAEAFRGPFYDLCGMGYELSPLLRVGACNVGAPHRRYRFFAMAHALSSVGRNAKQRLSERRAGGVCDEGGTVVTHVRETVANGDGCEGVRGGGLLDERGETRRHDVDGRGSPAVVDTGGARFERVRLEAPRRLKPFPPSRDDHDGWEGLPAEAQPGICRGLDGLPGWSDRLRALGNGVMPQVVAAAWEELTK